MKHLYNILMALLILGLTSQVSTAAEQSTGLFTQLNNRNSLQSMQSESFDSDELLSVQHVLANVNVLDLNTETITLQLTKGLRVIAERSDAYLNEQGGLVWQGHIEEEGEVTLVRFQNQIAGTVHLKDQQFEISALEQTRGNTRVHEIAEVDLNNQMPDHGPDFNESMLVSEEAIEAHNEAELHSMHDSESESQSFAAVTIRVIVAYTIDTPSSVISKIQQAVAETNSGYSSSGINARLQLAYYYETDYYGSGDHRKDLNRFYKRGDGYMDEIFSLRDRYSADVAMLVINKASSCGRAKAIGAKASNAFAVVKLSCATGYYSFGHEIGHLLSARHDPDSDSKTYPYRDGHGFCYSWGNWRSIMSYNNGCKSRKNFWSDPTRTYNGVRRGVSGLSNNARVLRITTPKIANFRNML